MTSVCDSWGSPERTGRDYRELLYRLALTPLIAVGAQVRDYVEISKDKLSRAVRTVTRPPRAVGRAAIAAWRFGPRL
jgi:hypothetical protein